MSNWVEQRLLDLKAQQDAGEQMACPRCGRMTMNGSIHRNALSRYADLYICDKCGVNEALRALMKNPMLPEDWACMQIQNPFQADSIAAYMETIESQIPILERVFREWLSDGRPSDYRRYRYTVQKECPGVTELWTEPFRIEYRAKDYTRALIRFREKDGTIQYAIDTFEK